MFLARFNYFNHIVIHLPVVIVFKLWSIFHEPVLSSKSNVHRLVADKAFGVWTDKRDEDDDSHKRTDITSIFITNMVIAMW